MTDKPTLSIDQTEWRVLFASNIARVNEFVNQTQSLTPETLTLLTDHLERSKVLAIAWHRSQPPVQQMPEQVPAEPIPHQANGAEKPGKKRGGWPKGKKRGAPAQAVQ